MKTILVVYTCEKLSKRDTQTMKRYSFNTKADVKIGDLVETKQYDTPLQVVEILDACYKYVDVNSGELSNKRKPSTKQFEIRELIINTSADSAIVGSLVKSPKRQSGFRSFCDDLDEYPEQEY